MAYANQPKELVGCELCHVVVTEFQENKSMLGVERKMWEGFNRWEFIPWPLYSSLSGIIRSGDTFGIENETERF
jgi:hypothetical protein